MMVNMSELDQNLYPRGQEWVLFLQMSRVVLEGPVWPGCAVSHVLAQLQSSTTFLAP